MTRIRMLLTTASLVLVVALVPEPAVAQVFPLGSEFQVNQSSSFCPKNPRVFARADGGFVVVWSELWIPSIRARFYDSDGVSVGNERAIQSGTNIFLEDVAAKPDGSFSAVWSVQSQGGSEIRGRRFASDGSALGADFQIGSSSELLRFATAAMDEQGEFVVAWTKGSASTYSVEARLIAANGTPQGSVFPVTSIGYSFDPSVAKQADSGEFVITWSGNGAGVDNLVDVWAEKYDSSGSPVGSEFVVNSYTTGTQHQSAVALSTSGEMLVTWAGESDTTVTDEHAVLTRLDESGNLVSEVEVGDSTTGQARPSIAASPDLGSFVLGMEELTVTGGSYLTSDLRAAFNLQFDQKITSTEAGEQNAVAVAIDPTERVTLVWLTDPDGDQCSDLIGIRGQLYRQLATGETRSGVHSSAQQVGWKYYLYPATVPDIYEILLSNLTADADLYVRVGSLPTAADYDCRPYLGGVQDESCLIFQTGSQWIFVGVNGYQAGTTSFTLTAGAIPPWEPLP